MASLLLFTFPTLTLLFNLILIQVTGEVLYADGYTVTTVIDGDKLHLNPQLILPQYGSSDLILLDSSASTFYTISFPSPPQESVIKKLTGNNIPGYKDGTLDSATFNKPKSFAVDFKGNIYVADKNNHAIRIITRTGVATIAGGYTQKPGHMDGPSQNATFSDDFELAFAPDQCALMISDHGNRLVRQISLNADNCKQTSKNVLGNTSTWILGLLGSCLLGLAIGFVIRPYIIIPQVGQGPVRKETWNPFLINVGRQVRLIFFDIKSVVVSSPPYTILQTLVILAFSQIALMFSLRVVALESKASYEKPGLLIDFENVRNVKVVSKGNMVTDQLKDLITFDENLVCSDSVDVTKVVLPKSKNEKIDDIIEANIMGFVEKTTKCLDGESCLGLVKGNESIWEGFES